jgi:futalosine hydrolase
LSHILIVAATERELCGADGLVCGVGPVEAAAATARALALRPFAAVLHVGLAGGRGLDVGTTVVGTEAVYCDLEAEWRVVDRVSADATLVAAALGAVPGAATSAAIHTSAAVGRAPGTVSEGVLVEAMEGFGVLRAAELAAVSAVELRVISNEIGEVDRARWSIPAALEVLERALPGVADAVDRALAQNRQ